MADDPLAAEIARHVACTCDHHRPGGPFERHYCAWCGAAWPCLVRRLADLLLASEGVLIDAPALAVRENDLRLAAESERDALRAELVKRIVFRVRDTETFECSACYRKNRSGVIDGIEHHATCPLACLVTAGDGGA